MSNPGDALQHKSAVNGKADEYYAWKLMSEKMAVWGDDRYSAEAKKVLGASSQREAIKFKILEKILSDSYGESSANYAQLVYYTGKEDKLAQAEVLADKVFKKYKERDILSTLVGDDTTLQTAMSAPGQTTGRGTGLAASIVSGISALLPK